MTIFDIFEQELTRIGHDIEVDKYEDCFVITDLTIEVYFYFSKDGVLDSIDKFM